MRAQPSTLLEVKGQQASDVTEEAMVVESAVADYTQLFKQMFEVLTSL